MIQQHWNAPNSKQSVIQTPKSNSPRDFRQEVISPVSAHPGMRSSISPQVPLTSMYSNVQSHEAFQTLVNAAAAQPSLALPMDRRSVSSSGSRSDTSIRSNIKEKSSVEGLEKSLMEMHSRPRGYQEMDSNKIDDKMRPISHESNRSVVPMSEEYAFLLERKRLEQFADSDRQRYSDRPNPLSQPSLRFSREPFSKEQFERELRQPIDPIRHINDHNFKIKAEDLDASDSRHGISVVRSQVSELDNEASKLFSQSFQKDNPKTTSSRGQFTAANLIDAIITHQINSTTESPNGKTNTNPTNTTAPIVSEASQTGVNSIFSKYRTPDKLMPNQYPNREEIVTIADSPDPEKSYPVNEKLVPVQNLTNPSEHSSKNITYGEHISTLISKSYTNENRTPPQRSHSVRFKK